jgi:hypothetical protein
VKNLLRKTGRFFSIFLHLSANSVGYYSAPPPPSQVKPAARVAASTSTRNPANSRAAGTSRVKAVTVRDSQNDRRPTAAVIGVGTSVRPLK